MPQKSRQIFREGKVHVLSAQCATCIFHPGNKMRLERGRVKQMVDSCLRRGGAIPCHDTLSGPKAICRGFFNLYKDEIPALQVADRLGYITYQQPPPSDLT